MATLAKVECANIAVHLRVNSSFFSGKNYFFCVTFVRFAAVTVAAVLQQRPCCWPAARTHLTCGPSALCSTFNCLKQWFFSSSSSFATLEINSLNRLSTSTRTGWQSVIHFSELSWYATVLLLFFPLAGNLSLPGGKLSALIALQWVTEKATTTTTTTATTQNVFPLVQVGEN